MTLSEIQATVYDTVGLAASPDAVAVARLLRYTNMVYHRTMGLKGIGPKLRRSLQTFSTVANSPFATLPQSVVKIQPPITSRANNGWVDEMTLGDIRLRDPGLTSSSAIPYGYAIYNMADTVAADPSAAGQITAVSDAAGDTGASFTVYIEVVRTGGYWQIANVNLNGITPVNLGPVDTIQVRKVYIKTAPVGNVTIKDGAGNTLSVIPIGHTSARYTRLHMFPTPSTAAVLYADTELHIENLANPNDEPLIPEDFGQLLVHGTLAREYKKQGRLDMAGASETDMNRVISELRIWMASSHGGSNTPARFSQLGGYYRDGS